MNALSVKATNTTVASPANATDPSLAAAPQQYDGLTNTGGNNCTGGILSVIWDLGSPQTLMQVNCYSTSNWAFAVSTDGTNWSTGPIGLLTGHPFSITNTARYVRFNTAVAGASTIYETQVFTTAGIVGGPAAVAVRSGVGATPLSASSSALADDPSQYDGNTTSGGVTATGNYATVIWDFGVPTAMTSFTAYFGGAFSVGVAVSNDGANWQAPGFFGAITSGANYSMNISARYFRFSSAVSGSLNIYETILRDSHGNPIPAPSSGGGGGGNSAAKIVGIYQIVGVPSITF